MLEFGSADILDYRVDRLRGYFAFAIMLGHSMDIAIIRIVKRGNLVDFAAYVADATRGLFGFSWVIGFIVISGYCIARSCERRGDQFRLWQYFLMRVTRIYPLLIVATLITLVLEWIMLASPYRPAVWQETFGARPFLIALFGLSGFLSPRFVSLSPSYTISYELLFYLIWGFVWFGFRHKPGFAIWTSCILWAIMYLTLSHTVLAFGAMLFISWLMGAAAWVYRDRLSGGVPNVIAWIILIVTSMGIAISQQSFNGYPDFSVDVLTLLKYLLLSVSFLIVILSYVSKPDHGEQIAFDRFLGEISYPLFVIHGPVVVFMGFLMNWSGIPVIFSVHLLILIVAAVSAAYVFVVAVERPLMAWRRNLGSRLLS